MVDDAISVRLELVEPLDVEPQIRRLTGREAISGLFAFELEVVLPERRVTEHATDLDHLLGARATLVWERDGAELRRLHGILCEVAADLADASAHQALRLRFVPRAWTLGLVEKTEIFMDLSLIHI